MDILSTLKSEYSRTLILIVIPGAISLEPYAVMLFNYFDFHLTQINDYYIYLSFIYLFASLLIGYLIQDLGARLEILLDFIYNKTSKRMHARFIIDFNKYLFNKKEEEYIITHYYRSMLVRLKFELHIIVSIIVLWIGMFIQTCIIENLVLDFKRTIAFLIISFTVLIYQLYEAYSGVALLHFYRKRINKKFKPTLKF